MAFSVSPALYLQLRMINVYGLHNLSGCLHDLDGGRRSHCPPETVKELNTRLFLSNLPRHYLMTVVMEKSANSARTPRLTGPTRPFCSNHLIYKYFLNMLSNFAEKSESVILDPALGHWEIVSTRLLLFQNWQQIWEHSSASVVCPRELKIGFTGRERHLLCLRLKQKPDRPQRQKRWGR